MYTLRNALPPKVVLPMLIFSQPVVTTGLLLLPLLVSCSSFNQVRLNASPSGDFPVMLSNGNNPLPPTLIPSPPGGEKVDK